MLETFLSQTDTHTHTQNHSVMILYACLSFYIEKTRLKTEQYEKHAFTEGFRVVGSINKLGHKHSHMQELSSAFQ